MRCNHTRCHHICTRELGHPGQHGELLNHIAGKSNIWWENEPPTGPRLFIGVYPEGIVYADRYREQYGDYVRLASISYRELTLDWSVDKRLLPTELREAIEADATLVQMRRGQPFPTDACGHTRILGQ